MGLIAGPVAQPIVRPVVGGWRTLSRRFADILKGRTAIVYDPQDLTTMYQDAQGTLPVYRPGTGLVDPPVGLMLDKGQGLELGPELWDGQLEIYNGTGLQVGAYNQSTGELSVTSAGVVNYNPRFLGPVLKNKQFYQVSVRFSGNTSKLNGIFLTKERVSTLFAYGGIAGATIVANGNEYTYIGGSFSTYVTDTPQFSIAVDGSSVWDGLFIEEISIREIKGYHAYQTTTLARPTLSGRYNLLTATEALSTQSVTTVATNYTLRFEGAGSITLSGTATGTYSAGTHTITCTAGTLTCTVAGAVTRADFRKTTAQNLPAYQSVTNANTYDTTGFPLYLKRDRVDDDLIVQAPAINGVSAWGAAEGSLFGKVNIATGEYKPLGVITEGLTTCTQRIAIDGALSAAETAVLERFVAIRSGTNYDVTTADPVVFRFGLTSVSTFNFTLQTKSGLPVLVDWGDGNTTAYAGAASQTATKTYAASGNYTVKVYAEDDSVLTRFSTSAAGMSGTLTLPSGMTYFVGNGSNALSGTLSLPSGMTDFYCVSSNTLSGTLSLPSGMTTFYCSGSNTLSGTLSLPSNMTFFNCSGSNTLSGTLSLPSNMTFFNCTGSNTLSGYTPSAKASNQQRFSLAGQNTLSATDVDNILIDYAAAGGTWTGAKEITIQGNAANRTSASDAAYASLAAKLTTLSVD